MDSSYKLNTKAKLLLGFSTIITVILISIFASFSSLRNLNGLHNEMIDIEHTIIDFVQFHAEENQLNSLSMELFIEKNVLMRDSLIYLIKKGNSEISKGMNTIDSLLSPHPEQQLLYKELAANLNQNISNRATFLKIISQGKMDEAHNFLDKVQLPLSKNNEAKVTFLEKKLDQISDQYAENYLSTMDTSNYTLSIIGLCVILVSVLISISILRMLTKISAEIKSGVTVLGTSAAEILSTVTEISTGAAETATAVSETSTTVER